MKALHTIGMGLSLLGVLACSQQRTQEAPQATISALPLTASWISGRALLTQRLADPNFAVSVDLRVSDWHSAVSAIGTDSPCFRVALVERCQNGVLGQAVPRSFQPGNVIGTVPTWCPAVGTSFQWSAEFTDYRRVIGNPGSFFQPLMRCQGFSEASVHLFPSGLRSEPSALPRPGIPVTGLQVTEWRRL